MLRPSQERALLGLAQAGDETAKLELIAAYEPLIASMVALFRGIIDEDEARATAHLGLLEAIRDADLDHFTSVAMLAKRYMIAEASHIARTNSPVHIPERTMARFMAVMKRANNSVELALEVAPTMGMSPDTFRQVYVTLYAETMPVDAQAPELLASVEDQILATVALDAMTPEQRAVCLLRYGFDAFSEVTLLEAGDQLGMTRSVVYRHHAQGLQAARIRLGLIPA